MGTNVTNAITNVSGSVTATQELPTPSATQTPIHVVHATNGAAQTAYTVPANKTLYLMGASLSNPGAASGNIYENDGTTKVCYMSIPAGGSYADCMPNSPMAVYTAGQAVKVNFTNGWFLNLYGFLVG